MTDTSYDELLTEHYQGKNARANEGAAAIATIDNENAVAQEQEDSDRFKAAYDGSGLSNDGPPMDAYDYPAAHKNGTSFNPGSGGGEEEGGGGVDLPLEHFKPGQIDIGGFTTPGGFKIRGRYKDPEGHISGAVQELEKSSMNTKGRMSIRDIKPLTKAAYGMLIEGATYEDYKSHIKGPWKEGQLVQGWIAAKQAEARGWLHKQAIEGNIEDPGEPENWSISPAQGGLPVGDAVWYENLRNDPAWLEASAKVWEWEHGYDPTTRGIEPYELSKSSMMLMARYNAHTWAQAGISTKILMEEDSDALQALGVIFKAHRELAIYDPAAVARFWAMFAMDPSIGKLTKVGMKGMDMAKNALNNVVLQKLSGTAIATGTGAAYGAAGGAAEALVDQKIANDLQARAVSGDKGGEGMSFGEGEQDLDWQTIGLSAAFGGTLGNVIPAGVKLWRAIKAKQSEEILKASDEAIKPVAVSSGASAAAVGELMGQLPAPDKNDGSMTDPGAMP